MEALYRELFERAPVGLQILHLDTPGDAGSLRLLAQNAAVAHQTGVEAADDLGRTLAETNPQYVASGLPDRYVAAMESGEVLTYEIPYGDHRYAAAWYRASVIPLGEDYLALMFENVTDRRQLQDEIAKHASQLERLHRQMDTLATSVTADAEVEALREALGRIREHADSMTGLVEHVLALARVSKVELHTERVDLTAMAWEILNRLREREPDREVTCAVEDALVVEGDAPLLSQALESLLSNAWKFTSSQSAATIEVGSLMIDGVRTYFVRDDGAGFDLAFADRLFSPFERLHGPGEFEGAGIGLTTARRIVERHGGRIWAEAAPGLGATFFFTLP